MVLESPGESQDQGKDAQEGFQRPRAVPPSSSKSLLAGCNLRWFDWLPGAQNSPKIAQNSLPGAPSNHLMLQPVLARKKELCSLELPQTTSR